MAVLDKYVDANTAASKFTDALKNNGAQTFTMIGTVEIAADDDNASVYRFLKGLASNLVLVDLKVENDAITVGTDYDIGLYDTELGLVVDKDVFLDGGDLSSANLSGAGLNGVSAIDQANRQNKLWEHAGATVSNKKPSYDLVLTANVVGSAAGTVTLIATFAQS